MADIFQLLVDILKITPQQVSEYAAQGPLYQMFYLFVFPTVFLIIFIYILSYRVMKHHRGLRVVIAMVVYAFIILGGYYKWFVFLSGYWLLGMILLGFLFLLIGRGGDEGGGGGGAKRLLGSGVARRLKAKVTGREKQLEDDIKSGIEKMKGLEAGSGAFGLLNSTVQTNLNELEQIVRGTDPTSMGFKIWGGKYTKLRNEYDKVREKKAKEEGKTKSITDGAAAS